MLDTEREDVRFALDAVLRAAQLAQRVNARATMMRITKKDFSPVTVADFACQALVSQLLASAFSGDVLVGEESSSDLCAPKAAETLEAVVSFAAEEFPGASRDDVCAWIDRGRAEPNGRYWTLDPLDGTKGYLRGGQYAIALALIEDGVVRLGALACPNLDEECQPGLNGPGILAIAARGAGAWYCPMDAVTSFRALRVSSVSEPAEARMFRSYESSHTNVDLIEALAKAIGVEASPVLMDSQAKYAVMAAGGGELLFRLLSPSAPDYREKIWDQAAGSIILEEAGGRVTDLDGSPLDFTCGRMLLNNRGIAASNGALHARALEALTRVNA